MDDIDWLFEIDKIADIFEGDLRQGVPIEYEQYLEQVPEVWRSELRKALYSVEADCEDKIAARHQVRISLHDKENSGLESIQSDLPKEFGRYEFLGLLASGGMGSVYRALDVELGRIVALKLIRPELMENQELVQRFHNEVRTVAGLDHPGIVPVFDFGEAEGQHFFSMAFVDGQALHQVVQSEGPCDERVAAQWIRSASRAVAYAHQKGVIHRDIKPHNILLDSSSREPKVADFGLAKQLESNSDLTTTGQILGTPSYMSPEQAAGKLDEIGIGSDVYSLGATFYYLLTGRPPFQASSVPETIHQVIEQDPVSVRMLNSTVSRDIETICMKCLRKETSARYVDASALADDLDRWLNGDSIVARPVSLVEKTWKWWARRPQLSITVAGSLVVLIAVTMFLSWRINRIDGLRTLDGLMSAEITETQPFIEDLKGRSQWIQQELAIRFQQAPEGSQAKLNTGLALIGRDQSPLPYLYIQLLNIPAEKFAVVCDSLYDYRDQLSEQLHELGATEESSRQKRFRAAAALASYYPEGKYWQETEYCKFVANQLVNVRPGELLLWKAAFRPAKKWLVPLLTEISVDRTLDDQARWFAAEILADYCSDDSDKLFELLTTSDARQFRYYYERLNKHAKRAQELARKEVLKPIPIENSDEAKEQQSIRKANAAILLTRLSSTDLVWPLFQHSPDPGVRSYLIHWMPTRGVEPKIIIDRLKVEPEDSARRALILCLGQFDAQQLPESQREPLVKKLLQTFNKHPDPGVHSAAEWVLRKWGHQRRIDQAIEKLKQSEAQLKKNNYQNKKWYVDSIGITYAILRMKDTNSGGFTYLAVSTHELTNRIQSLRLDKPKLNQLEISKPAFLSSWYEAAELANWLSEKNGIAKSAWCFEPNSSGAYGPGMKAIGNPKTFGYRPPTQLEWNLFASAGASTERFFGRSGELLKLYANFESPSLTRVGKFLPNDFGLFDVLGNAGEYGSNLIATGRNDGVYDETRFYWLSSMHWFMKQFVLSGYYSLSAVNGGSFAFRPCRTIPRPTVISSIKSEIHIGRVVRVAYIASRKSVNLHLEKPDGETLLIWFEPDIFARYRNFFSTQFFDGLLNKPIWVKGKKSPYGGTVPAWKKLKQIYIRTTNQVSPITESVFAVLRNNEELIYNPVTGKLYQVELNPKSWSDANLEARRRKLFGQSGRLVSIQSKSENQFVQELSSKLGMIWLGGSDKAEEGKWVWHEETIDARPFWSSNEPVGPILNRYVNFDSNQPDDANGNQDILYMVPDTGLWDDAFAGGKVRFIIEWDATHVENSLAKLQDEKALW